MKDQLLPQKDANALVFVQNDGDMSSFTEDTLAPTIKPPEKQSNGLSLLPLASTFIFGIIYMLDFWPLDPIAHTCLSLLVTVAFLWCTEGIPAYATAYIVPLLCVWLNIGYDPNTGQRIPANKLASTLAWRFMDPIIFVFLGSMTMSECLSKYNITNRVSRFFFKRFSKKPAYILLSLMYLNMLIACFLSNVASTTLVLSFTMPIIRSLDPDDPYIKALLFGIAWSGNSGGMPTSIASPQNILALSYIQNNSPTRISFLQWVYFGVPSSVLLTFCEWVYLVYRFKPQRSQINIAEGEADYPGWSIKHTFACFITILTIALWTLNESFSSVLGSVGITSLIPVVCFFGSGMLTVTDFHSVRWSTLALMGGGLALGESMKLSGLLDMISQIFGSGLSQFALWPLMLIILFVVGIFASLINSSSAAAILYPVIGVLGKPTGHPNLLVVASALMVSGGQLFHISSFPNALVSGTCRHVLGNGDHVTQIPFLKGSEYFTYGWPTLFLSVLMVSTIAYAVAMAEKL